MDSDQINVVIAIGTIWTAVVTSILAYTALKELPRLRNQLDLQSEFSKWSRQNATQEIVREFFMPHIQGHWGKIHKPVIEESKTYSVLNAEEQESVRALINYLEVISSLIERGVVDQDTVFYSLGGLWAEIYDCAAELFVIVRRQRNEQNVYKNFEKLAQEFKNVHARAFAAAPDPR